MTDTYWHLNFRNCWVYSNSWLPHFTLNVNTLGSPHGRLRISEVPPGSRNCPSRPHWCRPEATGDFPEYRWPTSHLKAIFIEYVEQRAEFHCPSPHGFVSGFSDGAPIWAHGHPSVCVSPKIHWFKTSCSHHVHIMCAINSGHNLSVSQTVLNPSYC
jgi:hypothetical protein